MTTTELEFLAFAGPDGADAVVEELVALQRQRIEEFRPGDPMPTIEKMIRRVRSPEYPNAVSGWVVARRDGRMVGYGSWHIDLQDNPQQVWLSVFVPDERRRKGIGARLIDRMLVQVEPFGPSMAGFGISVHVPVGQRLAEWVEGDWALVPRTIERVARLKLAELDRGMVDEVLAARRARLDERYRPLFFAMDELPPPETGFEMDDFLAMVTEIENLMPLDDLALNPEHFTRERFQAQVDTARFEGRVIWNYVVCERATGHCVGITNVAFDPEEPQIIHQWDTGVIKTAQEQGLGKYLKVLMLAKLLDEVPGALYVDTENAATNAAMIAVNTALGFQEHFRTHDYQIELPRLRERVDAMLAKGGAPSA